MLYTLLIVSPHLIQLLSVLCNNGIEVFDKRQVFRPCSGGGKNTDKKNKMLKHFLSGLSFFYGLLLLEGRFVFFRLCRQAKIIPPVVGIASYNTQTKPAVDNQPAIFWKKSRGHCFFGADAYFYKNSGIGQSANFNFSHVVGGRMFTLRRSRPKGGQNKRRQWLTIVSVFCLAIVVNL